jgi:hypothetical protein
MKLILLVGIALLAISEPSFSQNWRGAVDEGDSFLGLILQGLVVFGLLGAFGLIMKMFGK